MSLDFEKPFYRKRLVEDGVRKDVVTVWLNPDERKFLEEAKKVLEQEKDSTAFKQLALLGFKTLRREDNEYLLALVFANKRKNKRLGIPDFEA